MAQAYKQRDRRQLAACSCRPRGHPSNPGQRTGLCPPGWTKPARPTDIQDFLSRYSGTLPGRPPACRMAAKLGRNRDWSAEYPRYHAWATTAPFAATPCWRNIPKRPGPAPADRSSRTPGYMPREADDGLHRRCRAAGEPDQQLTAPDGVAQGAHGYGRTAMRSARTAVKIVSPESSAQVKGSTRIPHQSTCRPRHGTRGCARR